MKAILITLLVFTSACLGPEDLWDTWERFEEGRSENDDSPLEQAPIGEAQDVSRWVLIESETETGTDTATYNEALELVSTSDSYYCRCMSGILNSETTFEYGDGFFEKRTSTQEGTGLLRMEYGERALVISSHREGTSTSDSDYNYVYDRNERLIEVHGRAFTQRVERDAAGNILEYVSRRNSNGDEQATVYEYNELGQRIESLSFYGTRSTFAYDERGRMSQYQLEGNFNSSDERFEYNDADLLTRHEYRSPGNTTVVEYEYDAHKRLTHKVVWESATRAPHIESFYRYDSEGFPLQFQTFTLGVLAAQIDFTNTHLGPDLLEVIRTDLQGEQRRSLYRHLDAAPTLPPRLPDFEREDAVPQAPTKLMGFKSERL